MAVKLLRTIKLAAPPSNLEEYYSTTTICIVATDHLKNEEFYAPIIISN